MIAVAAEVAADARREVPMQVSVTHAEQLIIHLFRAKRLCRRLRDDRHFLHKQRAFGFVKVKQLGLIAVLLIQKQRIAAKMLMVADYYIARFQLPDEIRVFASFYISSSPFQVILFTASLRRPAVGRGSRSSRPRRT